MTMQPIHNTRYEQISAFKEHCKTGLLASGAVLLVSSFALLIILFTPLLAMSAPLPIAVILMATSGAAFFLFMSMMHRANGDLNRGHTPA